MSTSDPTSGLADGTRLVVRAGSPTAEETVAIITAIDAATRADRDVPAPRRPAWLLAGRQESMGGRAAASPSDLGGWR
jgi:hypothetical protein